MIKRPTARQSVAILVVTAATLVGVAQKEGWIDRARAPIKGDVVTIGPGRTGPDVRLGDKADPVREMTHLLNNLEHVYADGIRRCIEVPLYQHEFDAYLSLAYNVGAAAVCRRADKERVVLGLPSPEPDRLMDVLNKGEYEEACRRILSFDKFHGRRYPGLTKRRQQEYKQCLG